MSHAQKNIKFLAVFAYKFSKDAVLYRGKNAAYKFIEAILKENDYCKKVMKKHFNKNLIMSVEEEKKFQLSNNC